MNNKGKTAPVTVEKTEFVTIAAGIFIIIFLSNLNAIVDLFVHPEIPYFDKEHLVVGTTIGIITSILVILILSYIKSLHKRNKENSELLQELFLSKEKAEKSDKFKSAFIANMSHEIRTPMNGILGFTDLLKESDVSIEKQQKYISIIRKSGDRMLNIINDIIDISKIESGHVTVSDSEVNINDQIEEVYTFFKPEIDNKGLHFSFKNSLPKNESITITDGEKTYAILSNLVKNAIKFTKNGFIEFGYERKGIFLEFFVKDSGSGIPRENQESIFERFIQVDAVNKQTTIQGTGLGLSISKAFVEILGGKIWVESEVGRGSDFYFTIPYIPLKTIKKPTATTGKDSEPQKVQTGKLKILLVEDDETSDLLIKIALKESYSELLHAKTGPEAIKLCQAHPDLDLVLMDIKIPEMDGYEATRQIRLFNRELLIIAQTAYGLSGDREKAIQSGCNDYISKPIETSALLALIKKHIRK